MKKRFIALIVVMVMVCSLFIACSNTMSSQKKQEDQENIELVGSYHLYYTSETQWYLNFLETFDETKYEIVDISHSQYSWYVTYKDIEE